jgi:tetratricopeptide (TPR) repeat protein
MTFLRSNSSGARWLLLAATAAGVSAPAFAHAEGAEAAPVASTAEADKLTAAKALFVEGRTLAQAGHYAEACAKFEESLRTNVGVGTQFNLADCWEHLGKTSSAHALFLGVAASSHALGQSEREQLARERAAALEPRLAHLLIDVPSPVDGLVVRKNHIPLQRDTWGTDSVVDPGKYTIEASAPGKKTWSQTVEVTAFAAAPIAVSVPVLETAPATPAAAEADTPADAPAQAIPTPHSEPAAPLPPARRSTRRTAYALSLAAAGASGVVAGIWLGLDYRAQNERATQICPTSVDCTARQIEVHDHKVENAKMFRTWSVVGFGAGGVALAGAAYLFFGPIPQAKPSERAWTITPLLAADGTVGASAEGRF